MSNLLCFWSMALNTSKLRWPELASDFKLNEMEIGTPSNESFENSSAELPRSQTVSATLSRKPPKIGSKHLPPGSMLQTKHDHSTDPSVCQHAGSARQCETCFDNSGEKLRSFWSCSTNQTCGVRNRDGGISQHGHRTRGERS
jgi:hypothetical protein